MIEESSSCSQLGDFFSYYDVGRRNRVPVVLKARKTQGREKLTFK